MKDKHLELSNYNYFETIFLPPVPPGKPKYRYILSSSLGYFCLVLKNCKIKK